jgi:hypothetical protein
MDKTPENAACERAFEEQIIGFGITLTFDINRL